MVVYFSFSVYSACDSLAHTHAYPETFTYDEQFHWFECDCGKRDTVENHRGGDATCTLLAVCSICSQGYGSLKQHEYDNYKSDLTKSWYECDCGARDNGRFYFGLYPQTEVADGETTTALVNIAGNPITSTSGWTSYNYYVSGIKTDCMCYKDVTYNGEIYRGVYIRNYRPYYFNYNGGSTYQDENGYNTNSAYWFKYEPIEWTIVSEDNGYATIVCNMILDSQAYQDTNIHSNSEHYNNGVDTPSGIYANNYKYSTIRKWLNETFYQTAFNSLQQAIIQTIEVDNGVESTGYINNLYAGENTLDKVWLLSYEDVTTHFTSYSERYRMTTDYAQSQGAHTCFGTNFDGNGYWWLRSPSSVDSDRAEGINLDGFVCSHDILISNTYYGVVPALQIRL